MSIFDVLLVHLIAFRVLGSVLQHLHLHHVLHLFPVFCHIENCLTDLLVAVNAILVDHLIVNHHHAMTIDVRALQADYAATIDDDYAFFGHDAYQHHDH